MLFFEIMLWKVLMNSICFLTYDIFSCILWIQIIFSLTQLCRSSNSSSCSLSLQSRCVIYLYIALCFDVSGFRKGLKQESYLHQKKQKRRLKRYPRKHLPLERLWMYRILQKLIRVPRLLLPLLSRLQPSR